MTTHHAQQQRTHHGHKAAPPHRRPHRHRRHHPSTIANFVRKSPAIMQDLMTTFDLTALQAAAILGNLGTESADFTAHHEAGQPENRGGYGWAQWTGPRRRSFFAWADANHLARDSDAASLGYLKHELQTSHRRAIQRLKTQTDLTRATHIFMVDFEGPGIPHEDSRQTHAVIALRAFQAQAGATVPRPN